MSPISKSQQKATAKYVKNNYDRIEVKVPKGEKRTLTEHARHQGESLNAYANRAFIETMQRDNEKAVPEDGQTATKPANKKSRGK